MSSSSVPGTEQTSLALWGHSPSPLFVSLYPVPRQLCDPTLPAASLTCLAVPLLNPAPTPPQPHLLLPDDSRAPVDTDTTLLHGDSLRLAPGPGTTLSEPAMSFPGRGPRIVTLEYFIGAEPASDRTGWREVSPSSPVVRLGLGTSRLFIRSRDERGVSEAVGPYICVVIRTSRGAPPPCPSCLSCFFGTWVVAVVLLLRL
jgi:hypothetical protein